MLLINVDEHLEQLCSKANMKTLEKKKNKGGTIQWIIKSFVVLLSYLPLNHALKQQKAQNNTGNVLNYLPL